MVELVDVKFRPRFCLQYNGCDRLHCSFKIWVENILQTFNLRLIGRVRTLLNAMAWWLDVNFVLVLCARSILVLVL